MTLAIDAFAARDDLGPAAVDEFLDGITMPLVEGDELTFVWRGDADSVQLMHWIFSLPSEAPLARIENTDLWYRVVNQLPRASRVEYKFLVETAEGRQLLRDPLNPQLAHDPFGANSVATSAGYIHPEWSAPDPAAKKGKLERTVLHSEAYGDDREITVYLPAAHREFGRYPLLVAHDGSDYLRFSQLQNVLDNLIHRREIPPLVVALTDPRDRLVEYAGDPRQAQHIAEELLPALESRYPVVQRPDARALMGASFGAVSSFSTAVRYPGLFGKLLLQSGSFAFTDIGPSSRGEVFAPVVDFINEYRHAPVRCAEQVFVSCGVFESLIYENRSLIPVLQSTGMNVRYVESHDGHNWENWRDRLRTGLSWLFPGPLWLVYD
ncbi:MAG: enterochelin esterase-like enzyme [Pseudohongiellaceae bacterium]